MNTATMYFKRRAFLTKELVISILLVATLCATALVFTFDNKPGAHAVGEDSPIMGSSQLSGAQIAQWTRERMAANNKPWPLTNISLDALANLYVSEGNIVGVRGDVAFAQAIHETGWFGTRCAKERNNYAGIGASGDCMNPPYPDGTGGRDFQAANGLSGPQRSVRAQLHQLRNYADPSSVWTWNPVPEYNRDNFVHKGKVKTWVGLNCKYAYSKASCENPPYTNRYAESIFNNYYNPMLTRFGISTGYCSDQPPAGQQASGNGYWTVNSSGAVSAFGSAQNYGSVTWRLNGSVLGIAPTGTGNGYWLGASDGGIFSFGDAQFYGSTGSMRLNQPVVGMASTNTGRGYWLVARDGGIFTFGDAQFYGSTGSYRLNQPIVGMAVTPSGRGYWLLASDGGIFSFGDAQFFGSTGSYRLNQPIVGMASRPQGDGYWLVAADGGIFAFGNAPFKGSWGSCGGRTFTSIQPVPSGNGYYLFSTDGRVAAFGDARHHGSANGGIGIAAKK